MSTEDTGRQVQPFAGILQKIGKGVAHTRISEAMQQLVVAVTETGKKGTLTLTVTVEQMKDAETLSVSANCTVKLPQEQQASIFYADEAGNLTRNDPRQTAVDLAVVGTARRGDTA